MMGAIAQGVGLTVAKAELLLDGVELSQCRFSAKRELLFWWQRPKPLNHPQRIGLFGAEASLGYGDRLVDYFT
jgi:hypothetical protein